MPPISIVILTQDEEVNIGACLDSVSAFDDVHVLDSGSTDATVRIVQERGIPLYHHAFSGFGDQRNWAIDNIPTRHDWQFQIDADERLTPEFAAEMLEVIERHPDHGGFEVASKLMFGKSWLRRAGNYPTYQVRLFHRERLRYVNHGHGQRETTSRPIGRLRQPFLHYAFAKGLDHWFCRHAVYARKEAEQSFRNDERPSIWRLFSSNRTMRHRAIKRLSARLPGRYFLRLFYSLIIKGAFLDGQAGIAYAHMIATYESMINVHQRILRHQLEPQIAARTDNRGIS